MIWSGWWHRSFPICPFDKKIYQQLPIVRHHWGSLNTNLGLKHLGHPHTKKNCIFFYKNGGEIPKCVCNHNRIQRATEVLRKNNAGGITFLGFELYYNSPVTKAVWCWHRSSHRDPGARIQGAGSQPTSPWSSDISHGDQDHSTKRGQSQHKVLWNWGSTCTRTGLDSSLTACTKSNSRWMKDFFPKLMF